MKLLHHECEQQELGHSWVFTSLNRRNRPSSRLSTARPRGSSRTRAFPAGRWCRYEDDRTTERERGGCWCSADWFLTCGGWIGLFLNYPFIQKRLKMWKFLGLAETKYKKTVSCRDTETPPKSSRFKVSASCIIPPHDKNLLYWRHTVVLWWRVCMWAVMWVCHMRQQTEQRNTASSSVLNLILTSLIRYLDLLGTEPWYKTVDVLTWKCKDCKIVTYSVYHLHKYTYVDLILCIRVFLGRDLTKDLFTNLPLRSSAHSSQGKNLEKRLMNCPISCCWADDGCSG